MADTKTAIGTIINSRGVITATRPDGSERLVSVNDKVYINEKLTSQFHAFAEIKLFDGRIFDLPSETTAMMVDAIDPQGNQDFLTPQMIARIQQAIQRGEDPTSLQPAPAAGEPTRESGQIFEPVFIVREGRVVTPESGFESTVFPDDEVPFIFEPGVSDGNNQISPPLQQPNSIPQAGDITLTASEQNLHEINPSVVSVVLPIDAGADGLASIVLSASQPGLLNSDVRANGEELTFTITDREIQAFADSRLVFSVAVSNSGELTYTQFIPFDNQILNDNDLIESFGISYFVTDGNGDTAEGSILINVADAVPSFEFIEPARLSESGLAGGSFTYHFGKYDVDHGADGPGRVAINSDLNYLSELGLTSKGIPLTFQIDEAGYHLRSFAGDQLVLEVYLFTDKTYKTVLHEPLDHLDGANELIIPVRINATDSEGDLVTDSLDITIVDHESANRCLDLKTLEDKPLILELGGIDAVSGLSVDGSVFAKEVITPHGRIELANGIATYIPSKNFSGTDTAKIQVQSIDGDVHEIGLTINVIPVADAPIIKVNDSFSLEDMSDLIAIKVNEVALIDQDGSESLARLEVRVPTSILNAGGEFYYNNAPIAATFIDADSALFILENPEIPPALFYRPPVNNNTDFDVHISATTRELANGHEATTSEKLVVNVKGVTDLVLDSSEHVSAKENAGFITLNVPVSNQDIDGSETLTLWVGPLLNGGTVKIHGVTGSPLADGRIQFDNVSVEQIRSLQFQAPKNVSGHFSLPIIIKAVEDDANLDDSTDPGFKVLNSVITITIDGTNDGVTLCTAKTLTTEDVPVHLRIQGPVLNETEGSEIIVGQIILTGFPKGSQLFFEGAAIPDVSSTEASVAEYRIDAANAHQLNNLLFIPAANSNLDFIATIQVSSAEINHATGEILDSITQIFDLPVVVIGDADTPIQNIRSIVVAEDHWIDLNLEFALTDIDGSETARLMLKNVPAGTHIDGAEEISPSNWLITADNIGHVRMKPPTNSDENFSIQFVAEITEDDGDTKTFEKTIDVTVEAVADAPRLTAKAEPGREDQSIQLDIKSSLTDNDGSEILTIEVRGLPEDFSLSSGELIEGGLWRLRPDQLDCLSIIPPHNRAEDFELTITAISAETGAEIAAGGEHARTEVVVPINMCGVASTPSVKPIFVDTYEDTSVALGLDLHVRLNDRDGSEKLSILLQNVPEGALITGATELGNGQWAVDTESLSSVEFVPPKDFSGRIELRYTATATEIDGDSASVSDSLFIDVKPLVDITNIEKSESITTVTAKIGATIPLSLDPGLNDIDGSESIETVRLYDVPESITILDSFGKELEQHAEGYFVITPKQMDAASIKINAIIEDFSLRIQADIIDASNIGNTKRTVEFIQNFDMTASTDTTDCASETDLSALIVPKTDLEKIFKSQDEEVKNIEKARLHSPVKLNLENVHQQVTDSEVIFEIALKNLPKGTLVYSGYNEFIEPSIKDVFTLTAEQADGATLHIPESDVEKVRFNLTIEVVDTANICDKTRTFKVSETVELPNLSEGVSNETNDLHQLPPGKFDEAISAENSNGFTASRSKLFAVSVEPAANQPDVLAKPTRSLEDQWIKLNIDEALYDQDDSEALDLVFSGYPEGTEFNVGVAGKTPHTWELVRDDLKALQIKGPELFSGSINFTTTARGKDSNGQPVISTLALGVILPALADAPSLAIEIVDTSSSTKQEGSSIQIIPVSFLPGLIGIDDSENSTAITLSGLPDEAHVTNAENQGLGRWYLPSDMVSNSEIVIDANHDGLYNVSTEVSRFEHSNGDKTTAASAFTLQVKSLKVTQDSNILTGSEKQDSLHGEKSNDILDGGQNADHLYGTEGDNTMFFDPHDNIVDGGMGFDTLIIKENFGIDFCASGIENFESITVADGTAANITLSIADVLSITDDSNKLFINGSYDDTLSINGNWIQTTEHSFEGYVVYNGEFNNELATLVVDNSVHIMG